MKQWTRDGYVDLTKEEIAHKLLEEKLFLEEKLANQYKESRLSEYPSFFDYLDGIVKGDKAQVDSYINACLAVKAKYPKPNEKPVSLLDKVSSLLGVK
jgi:hypothetical protein